MLITLLACSDPLAPKAAEWSVEAPNRDASAGPWIDGHVVIVDRTAAAIHPSQALLDASIRATKPDDVGTLVQLACADERSCVAEVVSVATATVLTRRTLKRDDAAIAAWVVGLPRVTHGTVPVVTLEDHGRGPEVGVVSEAPLTEDGRPSVRLFVDNGTAAPVDVEFGHGLVVTTAAGERTSVWVSPGQLVLHVAGGDVTFSPDAGEVWVFNPDGAWDYALEQRQYSRMGLASPSADVIRGAILLGGRVHHPFEPLPETIAVQATSALFAQGTRQGLSHQGEPHARRAVATEPGLKMWAVIDHDIAWIRSDVTWDWELPDMIRESGVVVYPRTAPVNLACDGVPLGRIGPFGPRDPGFSVRMGAGPHHCEATDEHGVAVGKPFAHTFESRRDYQAWEL